MPQRTPPCQLGASRAPETSRKSPTQGALRVAYTAQWLTKTSGRIATDPYSWMQAVHWVAGSGLYKPSRTHGPKWGPTTVLIAQEIAALTECRPSVDYLARKLDCSVRTVKYHLGMLREAALLVYRSKGTRISGSVRHASVFERVIPTEFDEALGIRTILRDETAPAYTRVPVGAAPEHHKTLGKLAKKAARKQRRTRRKKIVAGGSRCTLMQGGSADSSPAAGTWVSPRGKLASGDTTSPTPQRPKLKTARGKKTLNRVGRRYQLARECQTLMPWLGRGSLPRLSWILRDVADAGWTALEVQAVAEDAGPIVDRDVARPSGLLAHRLKGAHLLYDTAAKRRTAVHAWQDSPAQQRARHQGYDGGIAGAPQRLSVQRIMTEAIARARAVLHETAGVDIPADDDTPALEDLTREQVIEMRRDALRDPQLIHTTIDFAGEAYARRLYTNRLVDQVLAAAAARHATVNLTF